MNPLLTRVSAFIATLGPVGKLPMPGTCGTLCAIPILYEIRQLAGILPGFSEQIIILALSLLSFWIIGNALYILQGKDPQEIILDEVIGFAIAMFGMPFNPLVIVIAFCYFRIFDILKPLGIDSLESMPGAMGIMADDIAAGALAHLATSLTLYLF
ncbi:TPA: phosphatidylglycerophosphatase A [Candidatus Dependentiae bacterium]|nr:MAG: Phosphatidylglycerophosphatase A [candidate division TM6 bacterium GW2011_GWF2_43_87]HBL98535.1 phosphatidylglycerophosphatase A [Candidatus Dependentiae bacterium]